MQSSSLSCRGNDVNESEHTFSSEDEIPEDIEMFKVRYGIVSGLAACVVVFAADVLVHVRSKPFKYISWKLFYGVVSFAKSLGFPSLYQHNAWAVQSPCNTVVCWSVIFWKVSQTHFCLTGHVHTALIFVSLPLCFSASSCQLPESASFFSLCNYISIHLTDRQESLTVEIISSVFFLSFSWDGSDL